jgi:site-specific DNA recombinase
MMTQKQGNGAVLYVRVSTEEQANDPLNLEKQEQRCRQYCEQRGWAVERVFVGRGESARTADRAQFQQMLAYCRANGRKIRWVVVHDLSRFARNAGDQAQTIAELRKLNISVSSTYEPNIDDTAAGKLAANIFGTLNQYYSDALSEKQRDRCRETARGGRFPWLAPIGYKNVRSKEGANIVPDEERAPVIRRAFERIATGVYKQTEVLGIVTAEGLTTNHGNPVAKQTFQKLLRNCLYAGWIAMPSDPEFTPVRGLHEPLVDQETFDRVQAILDGKKPRVAERRKVNPLFPLRHFVKCGVCGTPLTGACPQGRNKKKYPRYWCRKPGCQAVSLSKATLESEFLLHLGRLRAAPDIASDFLKVVARVWQDKQGNSERRAQKLTAQLEEQKTLKSELLKMRIRKELPREEFEQANAEFARNLYEIEEQLRIVALSRSTSDSFIRFAELQFMDIGNAWRIAGPEQRQRVQNLLFEGGLDYSPGAGILNRSNCSLFCSIEAISAQKSSVVGPPGLEPGANEL